MKTKSLSYLMSGVVAFSAVASPALSFAQTTAPASSAATSESRETLKVEIATKIAENLFLIQKQKSVLASAQEQMKNGGKPSLLDGVSKVNLMAALGFAAVSGYAFYKMKKAQDIRVLFYGFGGVMAGAGSAGFLSNGLIAKALSDGANAEEQQELDQAISEAQQILTRLEGENKTRLDAFRKIDSQIDQKISALILSENHRIEKINEIAKNLGEARAQLGVENKEVGLTAFFAASSTITLIKTAVDSTKGGSKVMLAINAAVTAGLGAATYYQANQRSEVLEQIDVLQSNLSDLEKEYKASIVAALTSM